ncbi:hypothetical protein MMZ06_07550, partial [Burkholderia gladioli]|uniref:hypothetical protein n=1 Tax=Burkholderia gladioli TaxID=28095 RepID=UPI001F4A33FE
MKHRFLLKTRCLDNIGRIDSCLSGCAAADRADPALFLSRAVMNHPKHIDPRLDPTRVIRAPRGSEK